MSDEMWRPVPDFPGYEVSSLGRARKDDGYILKAMPNKGYARYNLYRNKKPHYRRISRLVLEVFVGPSPPGTHAAHLDGDRSNNKLSNLAWVSPRENEAHKFRHGTAAIGSRHGSAKLTEADIGFIVNVYRPRIKGVCESNVSSIAARFGVAHNTILDVVNGTTWTHARKALASTGGK